MCALVLNLFEIELHMQQNKADSLRLSALDRAYFDGTGRSSYSSLDESDIALKVLEFSRRIETCDHHILALNRPANALDTSFFDHVHIGEQAGLFALLSATALNGLVGLVIVNHINGCEHNDFTVDDAVGLIVFKFQKTSGFYFSYTVEEDVTGYCLPINKSVSRSGPIYEVHGSSYSEKNDDIKFIHSSGTTTFIDALTREVEIRKNGSIYLTGLNSSKNGRFLAGIEYEYSYR